MFFFFVVLLLIVQMITFWALRLTLKEQEQQRLESEVTSAATIFMTIFTRSHQTLNDLNHMSNRILAENFDDDTRSFLRALETFRNRIDADLAMSIDLDGLVNAQIIRNKLSDGSTKQTIGEQQGKQFPYSLEWLSTEEESKFYQLNDQIFQYSVSAVTVAQVETLGWIGFGNRIDNFLAAEFFNLTGFHINYVLNSTTDCSVLATSQEINTTTQKQCASVSDDFVKSKPITLGSVGDNSLQVIIFGSREDLLSSIQTNWLLFTVLATFTLIFSLIGAYIIAASISRPVKQLVEQAKHIARGHYDSSVSLQDSSEFGQLANEFNLMQKAVVEREREIIHNAYHDPLTNLPNRNRLFKVLAEWPNQNHVGHAVFLIKVNHIKAINESLGHITGDLVIKEVSERLESIKQVDLLSHLRSDEFVILVSNVQKSSIITWIDKITKTIELPYISDEMTLHLQTNIGVALSDGSAQSPGDFLRMADAALQMARKKKQPFTLYDKSQDAVQVERLNLMNELHNAIAKKQLRLFYQPKLDLKAGRVLHVEALIRWIHPELGFVPPDKFIPIAENTGQIDMISLWVLEEAARQHSVWNKQGLNISIAINVSAENLKNENFFSSLKFTLEQYNLDMKAIRLEVTESAVVEDPEYTIALLSKFKQIGIHLSIDDYGTGYSSLAQLKQLPVHELKIDMSFIRRLPEDKDDKIIVKSTIDLAHSMGLSVVAEGVENAAALQWLDEQGCEIIQGYYISKPLPADEFKDWLNQSEYI